MTSHRHPRRVQRTRKAGQPGIPAGAVYIGRGSRWGNPWRIVRHTEGTFGVINDQLNTWTTHTGEAAARSSAVSSYRTYLNENLDLAQEAYQALVGKDLACWCSIPDPFTFDHCHGSVLIEVANWGTYCPHGHRIVERDFSRTDVEGYPVDRIVTPWPCHEDGCSLERFEASEQANEDEHWESLLSEVPR